MSTQSGSAAPTPLGSVPRARDLRLRPVQQPSWRRVAVSVLALFVPVYATSFAVAAGTRHYGAVALASGITLLAIAAIALGFSRVGLVLHPDGLTEYGLLSRARFTPLSRIASAATVRLYDPQTLDSWHQLFLLDDRRRTLVRLRGKYWSDEQIRTVANHAGARIEQSEEPMTLPDLRRARRAQLYWFERHPVLYVIAIATGGTVVALAVAASATSSLA